MLWQRRAPPTFPSERQPLIPDADTVRREALQASWHRDRRVAQRRIVWRWTLWYAQRFWPQVLTGSVLLVLVAYFTGVLPSWSDASGSSAATAPATPSVRYAPPSVPTAAVNASVNPSAVLLTDVLERTDQPMKLRTSLALGVPIAPTPSTAPSAPFSPDTLSLKPEHWLHSKEP